MPVVYYFKIFKIIKILFSGLTFIPFLGLIVTILVVIIMAIQMCTRDRKTPLSEDSYCVPSIQSSPSEAVDTPSNKFQVRCDQTRYALVATRDSE